MSRSHARHNEEACDYLLSSKRFNDWVTTTAFYSALYYINHEIFPLNEKGFLYSNFSEYLNEVLRKKYGAVSKHQAQIILARTYLPSVSNYYKWLHDACMSARYKDYRVSISKAQKAREFLDKLKLNLKK